MISNCALLPLPLGRGPLCANGCPHINSVMQLQIRNCTYHMNLCVYHESRDLDAFQRARLVRSSVLAVLDFNCICGTGGSHRRSLIDCLAGGVHLQCELNKQTYQLHPVYES